MNRDIVMVNHDVSPHYFGLFWEIFGVTVAKRLYSSYSSLFDIEEKIEVHNSIKIKKNIQWASP